MPRFKNHSSLIKELIKKFHSAISYRDIQTILNMWLVEESVSYVNIDGCCAIGLKAIEKELNKTIEKVAYTEILTIKVHNLIGCVFVETLEAIKHDSSSTTADCYLHGTYFLVQNRNEWRFLRIHFSIASNSDVSYDKCNIDAESSALQ